MCATYECLIVVVIHMCDVTHCATYDCLIVVVIDMCDLTHMCNVCMPHCRRYSYVRRDVTHMCYYI